MPGFRTRWLLLAGLVVAAGLSACDIDWSNTFDSGNSDDNTPDVADTDIAGLNVAVSDYRLDQTEQNLSDRVANQNYYRVVSVDLAARSSGTGISGNTMSGNVIGTGGEADSEAGRSARVVIFDDPNRVTPIIAADRRAGLDLPPAMLVYRDDNNDDDDRNVGVAYNSSDYLAARYELTSAGDALDGLADDLARLAGDAASNEVSREGAVDEISPEQGLVDRSSDNNFNTTLDQLVEAIRDDNDLALIAQIDHREAARSIGDMLDANDDPSTLVIFDAGDPQARLIASGRTVGVDLPVRILVSRDTDGAVHLDYNKPGYLADRHGLDAGDAANDLRDTLRDLVDDATR